MFNGSRSIELFSWQFRLFPVPIYKRGGVSDQTDVLQGTLDLLIMRTIALEPMHGWAIAQRIQQISDDLLRVQQGSLYPALHRLEHQGWITAEWGASENNRRARFYSLTRPAASSSPSRSRSGTASRPASTSCCRGPDRAPLAHSASRLRSLFFRARREADLREELQFHLERETERLRGGRHAPRCGTPAGAPDVRRPSSRPRRPAATRVARRCSTVSVRDVRYACRSFRRAPLVALTIVTTVGLGLGLVAVVFTILNAFVFRVDEVRNPYELFAVERQRSANAEPEGFTRAQYEALVRETGVFSDAFARTPDIDSLDRRPQDGGPARHGELLPASSASARRVGARSRRQTTSPAAVRSLSSAIAPGPDILRAIPACSTARSC